MGLEKIAKFVGGAAIIAGSLGLLGGCQAPGNDNKPKDYTAEINSITKAADRIIATQNNDGTWEWSNPDTDPTTTLYPAQNNIWATTARGLIPAYLLTEDTKYLNAAKKTADLLLSKSPSGGSGGVETLTEHEVYDDDISFLVEFSQAFSKSGGNGTPYLTQANNYMNFMLTQSNRFGASGIEGHASDFVQTCFAARQPNLFGWDINGWVEALVKTGHNSVANDIVTAMAAKASSLGSAATGTYGTGSFYVLGLAGYLQSYATASRDFSAIENLLLAEKNSDGSYKIYNSTWDGIKQSVAYSIMALDAAKDSTSATSSVSYLVSSQDSNGRWVESDGVEYAPGNSEEARAIKNHIDQPGAVPISQSVQSKGFSADYSFRLMNSSGHPATKQQ